MHEKGQVLKIFSRKSKNIEQEQNQSKAIALVKTRSCQYNAYKKFGEILSACSKDIERKRNFDINQGP